MSAKFILTKPGNWRKGMYSEKDGSVSDVVDSISVHSPSEKPSSYARSVPYKETNSDSSNSEAENQFRKI